MPLFLHCDLHSENHSEFQSGATFSIKKEDLTNFFFTTTPSTFHLLIPLVMYISVISILDPLLINTLHPFQVEGRYTPMAEHVFQAGKLFHISSIYAIGRQICHLLIWFPKHMAASSVSNARQTKRSHI